MSYCVYIIYSNKLDKFYIGESFDLNKRLEKHKEGFYKSSFTTKAQDWILFFKIDCESKEQSIKIEKHLKKMKSRKYLHDLKKYPEIIQKLKNKYN